jgi:uncharacterized protein YndB with AHSA1/START domain/DNA-binding transcriptional ArsR family regulator
MADDPLSRTFAALADPTRRAILARLAEGEATVNELAQPFPITLQAISKHLKVLEQAGLIARGRTAQLRPSRLQGTPLKEVDDWIDEYRHFWEASLDRLGKRTQPKRAEKAIDHRAQPRAAQAGLTIARVFDAPRQLVWQEWTVPQRLAGWFGGATVEVPPSSVSIDLVPGGCWTATTLAFGPERQDTRWQGEYLEIIEPQLLAFTIQSIPGPPSTDLVTMSLTDLDDNRTEMTLRQHGHRTPEQYEVARAYWSREFDDMAKRLAERRH